jgi:hypothetical protein
MASERQIESNRHNSMRSTGPKTAEGRARSRTNALKHGMAAELPEIVASASPEFLDRRAKWSAQFQPVDEAAEWALDRAVAASLRIEICERTIDGIMDASRDRARLAWDQDQAAEAASIAGRLARDPVLASRQLETSRAGVVQLLELWRRLAEAIRTAEGWSDTDASNALDLLGVHADMRSGRTPIDAPEGSDTTAFREELALDEIERLKALRDNVMDELDEIERNRAMLGDAALFSKPAKLVLRYEREAWKRYRESIQVVRDRAAEASPILIAPTVKPPKPPEPRPAPPRVPEPPMPTEQENRELLAEAKAFLKSIGHPTSSMGPDEQDAWLEELESRYEAPDRACESSVTERSRFAGVALDPASAGV